MPVIKNSENMLYRLFDLRDHHFDGLIKNCDFVLCDMQGVKSLENTEFQNCGFFFCAMKCDFAKSKFEDCEFSGCWGSVDFDESHVIETDFTKCFFTGGHYDHDRAIFRGASFINSNMGALPEEAKFSECVGLSCFGSRMVLPV